MVYYWSTSFDLVGGGIRQNAEKTTQTFDAFLLNSGESSYPRNVSEIRKTCCYDTQLANQYKCDQALRSEAFRGGRAWRFPSVHSIREREYAISLSVMHGG